MLAILFELFIYFLFSLTADVVYVQQQYNLYVIFTTNVSINLNESLHYHYKSTLKSASLLCADCRSYAVHAVPCSVFGDTLVSARCDLLYRPFTAATADIGDIGVTYRLMSAAAARHRRKSARWRSDTVSPVTADAALAAAGPHITGKL
jgi:hypothetical protein